METNGTSPAPAVQQRKVQKQSNVSPSKKMGNERAPGMMSSAQLKGAADLSTADGPRGSLTGANQENNLFNKHYNKELKLCEDEIPMVLCELNESALAYLNRDQYENALLLLQKAHGVLDVVDLSECSRDQMIALQLFHNMAMCYQKQGQLEECALCLETTLDHLGTNYASLKNQSFGQRLFKLKMEAKLRLQFCAILSQLHRHKEAFEQAQEGIKIAHLIVRDNISICRFYSRRIDLQEHFGDVFSHSQEQSTTSDVGLNKKKTDRTQSANNSKNKRNGLADESKQSTVFENESDLKSPVADDEDPSIMEYQTKQSFINNLESSISIIEKTSKKLLPIYIEILKKISMLENQKMSEEEMELSGDSSDVDSRIEVANTDQKKKKQQKQPKEKRQKQLQVDMRHILGFLNQTEWIQNLNIGNIMQIAPLKLEDLLQIRRNEEALSRDTFLEVISFLIVGYFCASTEIRFIIQLKDEISKFENFKIDKKTQESEFWHTISLEIACSFLPSDCPLLNHILLSYQKHHSPSQTAIPENSSLEEKLRVIKPLYGIENSKFQPIIRELQNVAINLPHSKINKAAPVVSKILLDLLKTHQGIEERANIVSGAVSGQQAQKGASKLKNFQVAKLMKLEKLVAQFSKEVGIDKANILIMMLGEQQLMRLQSLSPPTESPINPAARPKSSGQLLNTGVAAKAAYNNLNANLSPNAQYQQSRNASKQLTNNNGALSNSDEMIKRDENIAKSGRNAGTVQEKSRIYDSESSQRDISFLNDLSQVNLNHHDKSFNEQIDDRSKFILNSNDANAHHNLSIGAIGNMIGQTQGGTVRQSSKRMSSNERGKIQRPRSSKGYRGNQILQAAPGNLINMSHQMSAHNLPSNVLSQLQQNQSVQSQNSFGQKMTLSKSEERSLKSQQNQRQILQKGPRQKTAHGANSHMASHTSHNFNKDLLGQQKGSALASLNSQLQSQSSTQLPSAQQTANLSKMSKKQLAQIQQQTLIHQAAIAHANLTANGFNSQNSQSKVVNSQKMKLNYDDLKKFLLKEYTATQAQQILAQHAANQIQGSASQNNFMQINQQLMDDMKPKSGKKKDQNDLLQMQSSNLLDQSTEMLPDHHNTVGGISSQQKKAKQILAQARKTSAHNNGQQQQQQAMIASQQAFLANSVQTSLSSGGPRQQQVQQQANLQSQLQMQNLKAQQAKVAVVPGAQFNTKPGQISQNMVVTKAQLENMREQNSKSALGQKSNNSLLGPAPNNPNSGNNSMKRREKGRLIMQEWLSKSGQNGNVQSQQQFVGLEQAQLIAAHQSMNQSQSKFINSQAQLTTQQQLQIMQHKNSLPGHQSHKSLDGTEEQINPKPFTSQEARRKSQPI